MLADLCCAPPIPQREISFLHFAQGRKNLIQSIMEGARSMVVDAAGGVSVMPLSVRNCSTARHRSSRRRKMDDMDRLAIEALGLPSARRSESRGPFWYEAPTTAVVRNQPIHRGLTRKESLQLDDLLAKGLLTQDFLDSVLVPINDESSDVPRLRALNWCVTNFAKGHPVVTMKPDGHGGHQLIDPAVAYAQLLKSMHRSLFDPYRRGTLLFFQCKGTGRTEYTTVGQLTFVIWCIENGVDAYVAKHEAAIRAHMNAALKGKRKGGSEEAAAPKKRTRIRELTAAPSKYFRGAVADSISYSAGAATQSAQ
jgi:hypothetical protein